MSGCRPVELAAAREELQPAVRVALLERGMGDGHRILVPGDGAVHLDAITECPAEQRRDGHAGLLAKEVEQRSVDGERREADQVREIRQPRPRAPPLQAVRVAGPLYRDAKCC
jgi:hypothetical protein